VPTALAMPRLGMTMQEGKVVAWRAAAGDTVSRGQVVLVIESEKAEVEIESPADGVLRHIYVEPGRTVPCATLLAALTGTPDEPFDAEAFRRESEPSSAAAAAAPASAGPAPGAPRPRTPRRGVGPVTPAARRRARELGLDPAGVPGTGPGGRVTREDVEAWAAARAGRREAADGVFLEVPSQGEGDPVALLPGFGADVSAFALQVPALVKAHRVLGVNPRGVGLSDAPEAERYDPATAARDVAALGEAPLHVIGASLGAAVAIELALEHPGRVRSLTLVTPFVRAGARLLAVIDAWCRLAAEASPEALARAIVPWVFSTALLADEAARERTVRGFAQMTARSGPASLARWAAGLRAWSGTREGDLGRIAAPTLVVAAADDLLTPEGPAIAGAIPGARCAVVPGAGHALTLEAPDAVNEAIRAHLGA
jgi:pimeloyl-ACP methyl ester carboxylesterase